MRPRFAIVLGIAVVAAALGAWLFPRAFPIVALEQKLTRDVALARADSFFRVHSLAPASARTAVRFQGDDSLRTFVELAGGGADSLNAIVRGDDVAPFVWSVRAFVPGNPREARVHFAPDGRIIGFERRLAEADARPTVSADSGRRLAERVIDSWIDDRFDRWKLVSSSYETKKTSGRVDRSYTFERTDRRIAGAPIRAEVVIAGDTPARLRPFVEIPESFERRYAEMRSWNMLLALLATLGLAALAIVGIIELVGYSRKRRVRWREPIVVGTAIGALMFVALLNDIPGSWFTYDTAESATTFVASEVLIAVLEGVATALLAAFTLAAAEAATRHAFPQHLDWWKLWRYRGTREVASRVGGGYAVAAIAFAYVALFYLVTRTLFGWWVPSELLDDPNAIASPMPWIAGIAISTNAAVWEEALFRALPLSLLSLWIGQRAGRRWWMTAGVFLTALVFGFAHSDYESWPPYSRGVEMLLDACFWAVLFIQFGILVTVVAHFLYDAVLFGLFVAAGDDASYRVAAAIVAVAVLAPGLAVLWRGVRQRGFVPAPHDARFAAWTPLTVDEPVPAVRPREAVGLSERARRLAIAAALAGIVVAVGWPPRPVLGPEFTADRAHVLQRADSMLRAHGGDPSGWRRLTSIGEDTLHEWRRFLHEHRIDAEAQRLAPSYAVPTWWVVRYVHTAGTPAQRIEEWRIRLLPDGRPLDTRHIVPDSASGRSADSVAIRRIAVAALQRERVDTSTLREIQYRETARPARRDVRVTYTDTSVKLPAGAVARVWVDIAGDEPILVRRAVELPEAFLRADRARQTIATMIAGTTIVLLFAVMIVGAIRMWRRLPVALQDGVLDRRTILLLVGALTLLGMLSGINGLPSQLYGYDTAEPWSTFVGITALTFVTPIVLALILVGLLQGLDGLRRRAGIPMVAGGASRSADIEMLVAGLGLGGIFYATSSLGALSPLDTLPQAPSTTLNDIVPVLSGIANMPTSAIAAVATVAIPVLVVVGLTPRRRSRVLIAVIVVSLLIAVASAANPSGDVDPARLALLIAGIAAVIVALMMWGAVSAWSWVIAALSYQLLDDLRDAVYGPVWQVRGAGALAVVVTVGLIALVVRHAASARAHDATTSLAEATRASA